MDPIVYHKQTLDVITQLCSTGKISDFSKRVPLQRRRSFKKFIDEVSPKSSKDFKELLTSYDSLLSSINNRLNPAIFELILKVGVKFKEHHDDKFWFCLMNTMDYGVTFDQPETVELLVNQVILSDDNSWKAACLLCILIQDYTSLKSKVARQLIRVNKEVLFILKTIQHYTLSCYVVELISQLENQTVIDMILGKGSEFPVDCYANDSACVKFLCSHRTIDSSIFYFQTFVAGDNIRSSASACQITSSYFIVLVRSNEFAAPVQFEFRDIKNIQQDGLKLRFHLANSPTKSLLNETIPDLSVVTITFAEHAYVKSIVQLLGKATADQIMMSTPRKISVVQSFIHLAANLNDLEDQEDINDIEDKQEEHDGEEVDNQPEEESEEKGSAESEGIEETESMFGSPINNNSTKDTSVSTKKRGRAVSSIIAESTREHARSPKNLQVRGTVSPECSVFNPSSFAPDTLDTALKGIKSRQYPQEETRVVESSQAEESYDKQNSDVWDFVSDEDAGKSQAVNVSSRFRSKAMKCLNNVANTSAKRTTKEAHPSTKGPVKKKFTSAEPRGNRKHDTTAAPETVPSSIDVNEPSSSELTSPIINAQRRASVRAQSAAPELESPTGHYRGDDDFEVVTHAQDVSNINDRGKKRPLDSTEENGQNKNASKKSKVSNVTPRVQPKRTTRYKNSLRENDIAKIAQQGGQTLTQIFRSQSVSGDYQKNQGVDEEYVPPKQFRVPLKPAPRTSNNSVSDNVPKGKETTATNEETSVINIQTSHSIGLPTSTTKEKAASTMASKSSAAHASNTTSTTPVPHPALSTDQVFIPQQQDSRISTIAPSTNMFEASGIHNLSAPLAESLLSEAYTNTLQRQIYGSISAFSNQLVKKIQIINEEINKKVMTDLTNKYESLFSNLRISFQNDVDEMCGFISDVKKLLNLPEEELVRYIKNKKFGNSSNQAADN